MIAAIIDSRSWRATWKEIPPGGRLAIGREPGAAPTLVPPIPDRTISRDHASLELSSTATSCELSRSRPAPGRQPPNPFYPWPPDHATGEQQPLPDPATLALDQAVSFGVAATSLLVLLPHQDELAPWITRAKARARLPRPPADTPPDPLPHAVREQLRIFHHELPRAVLAWSRDPSASPSSLFTRVAGIIHAFIGGAARRTVAFIALDPEGSSFQILNEDADSWGEPEIDGSIVSAIAACTPGTATITQLPSGGWGLGLLIPSANVADGTPLPLRNEGRVMALYATSHDSSATSPPERCADFLEALCWQLASLLEVREQQRIQAQLAAYFSPRVRQLVAGDPSELRPSVRPLTVLFCDRRASSLRAEQAEGDREILDRLEENRALLSKVSEAVFAHDGVIADFAGDGVLGFWGWPTSGGSDGSNHASLALETAAAVAAKLKDGLAWDERRRLHLPSFRIGISTGSVAVGDVGPPEQMKISVFGSPVNFGARLEGLGKRFRVPIIVSQETRSAVAADPRFLFRTLCYLRPRGFARSYPIHELVLPRELGGSGADPGSVAAYEEALEHFVNGHWDSCIEALAPLVALRDEPAFWLLKQAGAFQDNPPPDGWGGEIDQDGT